MTNRRNRVKRLRQTAAELISMALSAWLLDSGLGQMGVHVGFGAVFLIVVGVVIAIEVALWSERHR